MAQDGVRNESMVYEYDFLNRLKYADVFAGPQGSQSMVEQRFYDYDTIGNLMTYRKAYPSASKATGAFHVGGTSTSTNYQNRNNFNPMSGIGSAGASTYGSGVTQYVAGNFGPPPSGVTSTAIRGSFESGVYGSSTNYQGPMGINPFASSVSSTNYGSGGITPFVRGVKQASGSGGGGYSGPYGESTIAYTYGAGSAGPHAVTSRDIPNTSNDDSFTYDANGNMTQRVQGGVTWTQTFDNENRLVSVSNGTTTTQYVYDGSGSRIKKIVGNSTTIYVAGMEIEKDSSSETQRTVYYPAGGAFRVIVVSPSSNTLYYRHSDHLGSTSVLSDSNGVKVSGSDVVYAPFGEVRTGSETNLTDFGYTGQRHDDSTGGLMYYGARYYLPGIMRFISADTVMPGVTSQALNRYSYTYNNPINLTDPTGHVAGRPGCVERPEERCVGGGPSLSLGSFKPPASSLLYTPLYLPGSGSEAEKVLEQQARSEGGMVFSGTEEKIKETKQIVDGLLEDMAEQKQSGGRCTGNAPPDCWVPDYVTLNVSAAPVGWLLGISVSLTADYYGRLYVSGGPAFGASLPFSVSDNVSGGFLLTSERPSPQELENFLTGWAWNGNMGAIVGFGLTVYEQGFLADPYRETNYAAEVGIYLPQVGVSRQYGVKLPDEIPNFIRSLAGTH